MWHMKLPSAYKPSSVSEVCFGCPNRKNRKIMPIKPESFLIPHYHHCGFVLICLSVTLKSS